MSRLRHSTEVFDINNANTDIATIGNCYDIGEILEDLRLYPYRIWD